MSDDEKRRFLNAFREIKDNASRGVHDDLVMASRIAALERRNEVLRLVTTPTQIVGATGICKFCNSPMRYQCWNCGRSVPRAK